MFMVSRGGVMGRVVAVVGGIPEPELEPELGEEDGGSGRGKSGRIWSAGIEYGIFYSERRVGCGCSWIG